MARRYEEHLDVYYNGVFQFRAPWIAREREPAINYRHLIGRLIRKPGAFRHYRFKRALFPTGTFRWAYDALSAALSERTADREYLQILNHASETSESRVEAALDGLRHQGFVPRLDRVLELSPRSIPAPPPMRPLEVNLSEYDALLSEGVAV